jgi:GDP-mannose transporter
MDIESNTEPKLNAKEAALHFCISSVVMILINKTVALMFPYPSILLFIQNTISVLFLKAWKPHLNIDSKKALDWLPCVCLFCVNIYSSLIALKYVTVPTFTVFRNFQPILTTVFDFFLKQETTSMSNVVCLLIIIVGGYIYAYEQINFHLTGYTWILVHVISMSVYTILVKYSINTHNLHAYDMSFYNNGMSLVILATLVPFDTPPKRDIYRCIENMPCWSSILISAYGALCVSIAGFQAQECMSPTSWLTCNNLSKIPAIILSCFIWHLELTYLEFAGIVISLTGGYLYSLSSRNLLTNLSLKNICWLQ